MAMSKKLKTKWVKALRSGKYKQGNGALVEGLRDPSMDYATDLKHCCLGVLACEAGIPVNRLLGHGVLSTKAAQRSSEAAAVGTFGLGTWSGYDAEAYNSDLPETHTTLQRKLAAMNDNGTSFADIAKWIVKHVPVRKVAKA